MPLAKASLEKLIEEVAPERRLDTTPLFQVMLALQNTPGREIGVSESGALGMEALPVDVGVAKFDLSLALEEDENATGGTLTYRQDLFDRTTMLRFLKHFKPLHNLRSAYAGTDTASQLWLNS